MTDETKGNVRGPDIGKPDYIAMLEKEVASGGAIFEECQKYVSSLKEPKTIKAIQEILSSGDLGRIVRRFVFGSFRSRFSSSQVAGLAGKIICDEYGVHEVSYRGRDIGFTSDAELVGRNILGLEALGFTTEEIKAVIEHQQHYRNWLIEHLGRDVLLRRKNLQDAYPLHKVLELTREGYKAIKTEEGFNKISDEINTGSDFLVGRVRYSKMQELNKSRRNFEMGLHDSFPVQMKAGEIIGLMSQFPPIKNRLMLETKTG